MGVGLRTVHYSYLREKPKTSVEWFEAISENFMDSEGRPIQMLEFIRQDYPVALHGVSLSIGSAEGVDGDYLARLKRLAERIDPFVVSDHVCWARTSEGSLHDLLPLPYNEEALQVITRNLETVQDFLGRRIALENPSTYLSFKNSSMTEWDFIAELTRRSGCGVLLDVNNVFVSSRNQGFDPLEYINAIPPESVFQMHLGGYSDMDSFLFDTHSNPVWDEVWDLYKVAIEKMPDVPVLIEWDEDIPDFPVLEAEADRARELKEKARARGASA